ncbi:hypothetical protein ASD05_27915 [Variovorax sp. Root434]|nr:hypothetical protein ASD05_27915 [Variovorax sp. Root434]
MLGIGGVAFAWYTAATSREAELAREYLMTAPPMHTKYRSIDGLMLTGFRMANSKSYFTYWANTGNGRKFIKVMVDTNAEPWTVAELP